VIALLFVVDKDYSTLMMIMERQLNIKIFVVLFALMD
jgi:hypothetical protein